MFSKYYMDVVIRSKPLLSESTGVLHNGLTSWQGEKNRTCSNKNKYFILKILLYWVTIGFFFLFKFWLNTWLSMAKNTRMNLNNISFHFRTWLLTRASYQRRPNSMSKWKKMYFKSTLWRQYNQRMCSLKMWYVNPPPPPSLPFNNYREFFIRVQFFLTDRALR